MKEQHSFLPFPNVDDKIEETKQSNFEELTRKILCLVFDGENKDDIQT